MDEYHRKDNMAYDHEKKPKRKPKGTMGEAQTVVGTTAQYNRYKKAKLMNGEVPVSRAVWAAEYQKQN